MLGAVISTYYAGVARGVNEVFRCQPFFSAVLKGDSHSVGAFGRRNIPRLYSVNARRELSSIRRNNRQIMNGASFETDAGFYIITLLAPPIIRSISVYQFVVRNGMEVSKP